MIRINLLPEEYRRKARTPIKLMLAVTALVSLNASMFAWLGWLAFGVAASVSSEKTVLNTENDGLKPQVAYHKSLKGESARHSKREQTLAKITADRISWTRKLDELVDVVNRGDIGQRHLVWFDSLSVQQGAGGPKGSAGSLTAGGHSGSDNFGQVANFLDDLEQSAFIEDFHPPAPPEGTEQQEDPELMPSVVWAFPLSVELKELDEDKAKQGKGARGASK
jgi:Tfp pilus assembly protein PilN